MSSVHTYIEHQALEGNSNPSQNLEPKDIIELRSYAGHVLKYKKGLLSASKYVGIITTRSGSVVEILPKINLHIDADPGHEKTRKIFLSMLRCWRRLTAKDLPESNIRSMSRFPMLEVFFQQFIVNLSVLARAGLARRYIPLEENLQCLRGRLLFREQIRENLTNQARFYVTFDELSANRPSNRLIHTAITQLAPKIRSATNRQLLREIEPIFADIPLSRNVHADWQQHHIDRSMRHYEPVMRWVGLFLFNQGLVTFSGRHKNLSLLFPMEQVFEDFVTHSIRRFQSKYNVTIKNPRRPMATINGKKAFWMEPDILLSLGNRVAFILDAKWKEIDGDSNDPKHGISQDDMYQLFAYSKRYNSESVVLIYPQTVSFKTELCYRFLDDGPTLFCLPFDVTDPRESVLKLLRLLDSPTSQG